MKLEPVVNPCRLCPHVVVVGPERFNDLWSYAVEPLMPDRPKVRFQTKNATGVYAVRGRWKFTSGTRLLIRRDCASELVTT